MTFDQALEYFPRIRSPSQKRWLEKMFAIADFRKNRIKIVADAKSGLVSGIIPVLQVGTDECSLNFGSIAKEELPSYKYYQEAWDQYGGAVNASTFSGGFGFLRSSIQSLASYRLKQYAQLLEQEYGQVLREHNRVVNRYANYGSRLVKLGVNTLFRRKLKYSNYEIITRLLVNCSIEEAYEFTEKIRKSMSDGVPSFKWTPKVGQDPFKYLGGQRRKTYLILLPIKCVECSRQGLKVVDKQPVCSLHLQGPTKFTKLMTGLKGMLTSLYKGVTTYMVDIGQSYGLLRDARDTPEMSAVKVMYWYSLPGGVIDKFENPKSLCYFFGSWDEVVDMRLGWRQLLLSIAMQEDGLYEFVTTTDKPYLVYFQPSVVTGRMNLVIISTKLQYFRIPKLMRPPYRKGPSAWYANSVLTPFGDGILPRDLVQEFAEENLLRC